MMASIMAILAQALLLPLLLQLVDAQSSSCALPAPKPSGTSTGASHAAPSVASGYTARLVSAGLKAPRGIIFDPRGRLLVVQQGVGIQSVELDDQGEDCVGVKSTTTVIDSPELNHGIALTADGKTLYASSSEKVYSWDYNLDEASVGKTNKTIVSNMGTSDHVTRTLLLSEKQNDTLVVSRGSTSNIDNLAEDLGSGHCQIKAFDVGNDSIPEDDGYDFNGNGTLLGWGLRNSVGVAEHPTTGDVYSVENSVDQIMRSSKDIHEDNPGEEMNVHGKLGDPSNIRPADIQRKNYGYPNCVAVWGADDIPNKGNLTVGSQFVMGTPNKTVDDDFCARERIPPRLTFQAHMAPLDIKFTPDGNQAWVSFHGSWDRTNPAGYKLSMIDFANGQPVPKADSKTAQKDIVANQDNSKCPDGCFRPVGIALDKQGRIFMSSDSTGEIYVVRKSSTGSSSSSSTSTAGAAATSTKPSSASALHVSYSLQLLVLVGLGAFALI